jgi:type IV pilus assembly protein PilV
MSRNTKAGSQGFSLIEVLVAMLLLIIGVLGAAGMQLNALKYSQTSGSRTQATFLAYTIVDMMRANSTAAMANEYNIALGAAAPDGNSVAQQDLQNWVAQVQGLPNGKGSVDREPSVNAAGQTINMVTVTLTWDESRVGGNSNSASEAAAATDSSTQQFVFVTQL